MGSVPAMSYRHLFVVSILQFLSEQTVMLDVVYRLEINYRSELRNQEKDGHLKTIDIVNA